jgi:predicted lipoprotein with Yx(FWY)xxD motif
VRPSFTALNPTAAFRVVRVEAREAIMVRHIRLGVLSLAAVFVLSSCGGGSSSGGAASGAGSSGGASSAGVKAAAAARKTAALSVHHTSLGNVLVDGQGMTVYMLTADKPGQSSCSTQCLAYWPPVPPVTKPGKLHGISAKVASTQSMAGKPMATAGGWPLYTYVGDHAPGDTSGEGIRNFGGIWYAVSPSGQPVKAGSSAGSSSSGSSGGGYGY